MTYKIGDKIVLNHWNWIDKFATIMEIKTENGYPQYSIQFTNGSGFRWINDSEIKGLQFPTDVKVKEVVQFT